MPFALMPIKCCAFLVREVVLSNVHNSDVLLIDVDEDELCPILMSILGALTTLKLTCYMRSGMVFDK